MTKQHQQSNVTNYGNDGDSKEGNGNGDGDGNDAATVANVNDVDDKDGSDLRTAIGWQQKQRRQCNVNNDGNDSNSGDSDRDSDSDGDGDNAATAANSNNVDGNDSSVLRTAIGLWQLDNEDRTTMIWWRCVASNMQNACKCCATHPRQQSTNVDSLGRRRQERGAIWGDRTSVMSGGGIDWVEINWSQTFRPPQSSKFTGTYSVCILKVRLR